MDWTPPNPKYPPPKAGEPALHRAARVGDHDEIRRLVAEGADVNAWFDLRLDPGGRGYDATPLMVAAGSGFGASVETMHLLLELGADGTLSGSAGTTASFACNGLGWNYPPGGDADRLRCALDAGADPDVTDDRGVTLLALAARAGDPARVQTLLEGGANPNPAWDEAAARAENEAQIAADNGRLDEDLARRLHPTPAGPWPFEIPLHCAAEADSLECVNLLLDAGADATRIARSQRSAIYEARSAAVATRLVEVGVNIEATDWLGWQPLAAALEEPDKINALLAAGANPNATHDRGYTIFMSACGSMERSVDTLRLLIEAGADPHAVTELGYNALHAAIDVNGAEANSEASIRAILTFLFEIGVDPLQKNNRGETPMLYARVVGTKLEIQVLEELMTARGLPLKSY